MSQILDVKDRVALSVAISRYVSARDAFEKASKEFSEACNLLRQNLIEPRRFVAQFGFKHYLVTSDSQGNFDVELIDFL